MPDIGVKQECSLSPTLLGFYIDELEAFGQDRLGFSMFI